MKRRTFIQNLSLWAGGSHFIKHLPFTGQSSPLPRKDLLLNAYYFRAHMYTMVPHQIKEDMKTMAAAGTKVVSIAVLEQDLWAGNHNIKTICEYAAQEGMEVWGVPSRWGGLVAGAPKVPSMFSTTHPDTWMLRKDGTPLIRATTSGVVSSIHHPDTLQFFCETGDKVLSEFPLTGLIWDEPKYIGTKDYSEAAQHALGADSTYEERVEHYARFFTQVNHYLKERHNVQLSMFLQAESDDTMVSGMAEIGGLDYFGCDGRPWSIKDGGQLEAKDKTLLDQGHRFLEAARRNDVKSLLLVENHNLPARDLPLLEKGLPEVLAMKPDQLIYYYYPRNVEEPEKAMDIMFEGLRSLRK